MANNVENEIDTMLLEIASLSDAMQAYIVRLQELLEYHFSGENSSYINTDIYHASSFVEQNYSTLAYLAEVWG